jgi:hypothetical protein
MCSVLCLLVCQLTFISFIAKVIRWTVTDHPVYMSKVQACLVFLGMLWLVISLCWGLRYIMFLLLQSFKFHPHLLPKIQSGFDWKPLFLMNQDSIYNMKLHKLIGKFSTVSHLSISLSIAHTMLLEIAEC